MAQPLASTDRVPSIPQQARSAATRRRLLEATIETLVERGWSAASTTEIGRRAGVSQGAIFKHFPNKTLLMAESVEHLFGLLFDEFRASFARLAGRRGGDPVRGALKILWELFRDPRLLATFEIYLAARTDPALQSALAPVLTQHRGALRAEARTLFPEAAQRPGFDAALDTLLNALQGAALGSVALPDPASERAVLKQLEALARRELGELGELDGGR